MLINQEGWEWSLFEHIQSIVAEQRFQKGRCSIALTGGQSAKRFYRFIAGLPDFQSSFQNVDFFWGDERCVSPDHLDSNYRLVIDNLFANGLPKGARVHRMEAESVDLAEAAKKYAAMLPEALDVLLLSMGDDGHIASIFPNSSTVTEDRNWVVPVIGPRPPYQRLTITPPVIQRTKFVFILALGRMKFEKYEDALSNSSDISDIPAKLVLGRNWIFDSM